MACDAPASDMFQQDDAGSLGLCQWGCKLPGRYEHTDKNGRVWQLCSLCWHKAEACKGKEE